jgi:hypothetical protein
MSDEAHVVNPDAEVDQNAAPLPAPGSGVEDDAEDDEDDEDEAEEGA